jgi:hypothetical protein
VKLSSLQHPGTPIICRFFRDGTFRIGTITGTDKS